MPLDFSHEFSSLKSFDYVIGVDEAGRGPLAGPVVAGAFCFFRACNEVKQGDPGALSFVQDWPWRIVGDSKTLAETVRETIYDGYLQLARGSEVREADVSTLADTSTADASLEALPPPQGEFELEVTVSSEGTTNQEMAEPMSLASADSVEVEVESNKERRSSAPAPLFDHYTDIYFDFAISEPTEIDRVNILEASLRSMTRAVYKVMRLVCQRHIMDGTAKKLRFKVLVDGNRSPHLLESGMLLTNKPPTLLHGDEGSFISGEDWTKTILPNFGGCDHQTVVKGDGLVLSIAAGSIVAKVVRDRIMRNLALEFPDYGLDGHKGYPTPSHDSVVRLLGPSVIHRLSFAPIYQMLLDDSTLIPPGRNFEEIIAAKTRRRQKQKNRGSSKRDAAKGRHKVSVVVDDDEMADNDEPPPRRKRQRKQITD